MRRNALGRVVAACRAPVAGEARVLGGLKTLSQMIADHLEDDEFTAETEAETLDFLQLLLAKVAIAEAERLPLVAYW